MATPQEAQDVRLNAIKNEILILQRELAGNQRIGFCHNDLQYGNIMIDDDAKAITFIVRFFTRQLCCFSPFFIVKCVWFVSSNFEVLI